MKLVNLILVLSLAASTSFAARESGGRLVPLALKIDFWSPGNGIDSALRSKIEELISQQTAAGLISQYSESAWGREGEVTICVKYNDYAASVAAEEEFKKLIRAGARKTNLKRAGTCEPSSEIDPAV